MTVPDWQLPPGVDRGLWDYLNSGEMVSGYDAQVAASPLAAADVRFCEEWFPTPGRLVDLGCGTGRLCLHFARKGYECVGVDLSDEMLAKARENWAAEPNPPAPFPKREGGASGLASPTKSESPAHLLPSPLRGGAGGGVAAPTFLNANLVEPDALPDASFDYAACLFSTLGMVRGAENRAKVLANAFRVLKPGGRFVLHVHNRFYRGLGWGRVASQFVRTLFARPAAGDVTMPQAYGGAPLTLHHFTRREAVTMLGEAGFGTREVRAVGPGGAPTRAPPWVRAYGYLIAAERP